MHLVILRCLQIIDYLYFIDIQNAVITILRQERYVTDMGYVARALQTIKTIINSVKCCLNLYDDISLINVKKEQYFQQTEQNI